MNTIPHFLRAGIIGAATASLASADTVQVQDLGTAGNIGRGAQVTLSGGLQFADGSTSKSVWAGTRSVLVDGQFLRTFSLELTGAFGSGDYEQMSAADSIGQVKADAINALFAGYNGGEVTNREQAVAFQAMIWEIMYDYNGDPSTLDLRNGDVQVHMVKSSLFELMKVAASRGGSPAMLDVIEGDQGRNDLLRIVPLPTPAALAGLGLLGGLAVRRRRSCATVS